MATETAQTPALLPAELATSKAGDSLILSFSGDWVLSNSRSSANQAIESAGQENLRRIRYDTQSLGEWDTALIAEIAGIFQYANANDLQHDPSGLPEGVQSLLKLAFSVPDRTDAHRHAGEKSFLEAVGLRTLDTTEAFGNLTRFTGEFVLACGRTLRGKSTARLSEYLLCIQEAGIEALPIVGLISFLIGMIFAFVGVMQLSDFGAGIYTADLVAVAMVREMAPIMTAILMAGRTGAAYAATLGTMKVNEEIDALYTVGINPVDYLVVPRVIALVLMMPLLTMYASLTGILGGLAVALSMLDTTLLQYMTQTSNALQMSTLLGGLFKSLIYGALVALAGTQQGMACGGSAMAVGQATTRAVVMGIILIVISAAILTVIYVNLGI